MDVVWFKDLRQLANEGDFSRAAQLASISQPAFSRRIKALEDWVGTELVDRSTQPVRLTAAGQQMLEAGEQALDRIEVERSQIREALSLADRSVITFGAQHSIAWRFFPTWLQKLETDFGPLVSRLRADDLPNCFSDLQKNEVNFVVSYASDASDHLNLLPRHESLVVGKDVLVPVCKARVDGGPMFDIDESLRGRIPGLQFGDTTPIGRYIRPLLNSRRLKGRVDVVYENSMVGALRIRARDGDGVAWLPRSLVMPDLEAGYLALAGRYNWSIKLDVRIYRLRKQSNHITQKIWTFLEQQQVSSKASG